MVRHQNVAADEHSSLRSSLKKGNQAFMNFWAGQPTFARMRAGRNKEYRRVRENPLKPVQARLLHEPIVALIM